MYYNSYIIIVNNLAYVRTYTKTYNDIVYVHV